MKKTLLSRLAMLFVSAMGGALLFNAPKAFAAMPTSTWDGGGSDNKMTTAANWVGDVAPSAGDVLEFPAGVTNRTVVNDYATDTSFNSIIFTGNSGSGTDSNYTISGNAMTLISAISDTMGGSYYNSQTISLNITFSGGTGDITNSSAAGNSYLTLSGSLALGTTNLTITATAADLAVTSLSGTITGSGSMTFVGPNGGAALSGNNSSYTGDITVTSGILAVGHINALGAAAGSTTVASNGNIYFYSVTDSDVTYAEPLNLSGTTTPNFFVTVFSPLSSFGAAVQLPYGTSIFSGAITLNTDVVFAGYIRNAKITGTLTKNGHNLTVEKGTEGTLTIGGTTTAPAVLETEYKSNLPAQDIIIHTNNIAIVSGSYGDTYINGGTIIGKGTVKNVYMSSGIIAPGLSPGCLNTGSLSFTGGTVQIELGGTTECTEYDQLTVTGTVALGTNVTTLSTSLYNSYKPAKDSKYTIIKNDGTDAVTGTFKDLAEGATFKIDGYTFTITYKGGDGNDVVLTTTAVPEATPAPATPAPATPAPAAPDTGFGMLRSNPIMAAAGAAASVTIMGMGMLRQRRARR